MIRTASVSTSRPSNWLRHPSRKRLTPLGRACISTRLPGRDLVSKVEQREVRLDVGLPPGGFPKMMYFNRFHIDREDTFCLVQFGLGSGSGLIDSYSCVFSKDMVVQNREVLLGYLNRIGRPTQSSPPPWKGIAVERKTDVADIVTMAFHDSTAETCLFLFSWGAATRSHGGGGTEQITAQPLILLRSPSETRRQLIIGLYEEG